jgi:hypothetical protein
LKSYISIRLFAEFTGQQKRRGIYRLYKNKSELRISFSPDQKTGGRGRRIVLRFKSFLQQPGTCRFGAAL